MGVMDNTLASSNESDEDVNDSADNDSSRGTSRGTRIGDYLELWDTYYNTPHEGVYGDGDPGDYYTFYVKSDVNSFTIYLKNIYSGVRLENVNAKLQPGSDAYDLIVITQTTHNEYSMYKDEVENFYFSFRIGNSAYMSTYEFVLNVDFKIVDSSYNSFDKTGSMNFKIKISSRIRSSTSSSTMKLQALNKYQQEVPLYSGTKNQLLCIPNIYSTSGYLEDVEIILDPPSIFSMIEKVAVIDKLDTSYHNNNEPLWWLDDAGSVYDRPKENIATCKIVY
jgi:hypothetical protein